MLLIPTLALAGCTPPTDRAGDERSIVAAEGAWATAVAQGCEAWERRDGEPRRGRYV